MSDIDFTHLHLHSDYSLLDGACSISDILKKTQEYGMDAVAITDHGFMGGTINFYQKLNDAKVKPIIGCEFYLAPTSRFLKDATEENRKRYHIVLLAMNYAGYQNLCKLNTTAHLDGFYYKPRIDKDCLSEYCDNLIALTACIQGEIPAAILNDDMKKAKEIVSEYIDLFGRENVYFELMNHGMKEEIKVNKALISLSKEFDISLIATNDVHYIEKEHAKNHELMLCIQTRSTLQDEKRYTFSSDQFYFKSKEEMAELFREVPEALSNTREIVEKCNLTFKFAPEVNHYPKYTIPDKNLSEKEYVKKLCIAAVPERYNFNPESPNLTEEQKAILERIDYELGVIDKSKYCSYFLVVWDFLKFAREHKVPVGPGRGSGAGSIVAYLLHITDIDPLEYGLLFERFLNPERVSPPDFDIDFCERRRNEVIEYVRKKYGKDSVAQIGTYGTLKPKAVIKDIARVLGRPPADGDKITKLIPGSPKNLEEALENNKELYELMEKEEWVKEIFEYSKPLVGLNRNQSIHAAGVIIGDQRLDNLIPLTKGANNEIITQYSAGPCEDLGLLKMDFLGLRTLTIIQDTIDIIKRSENIDIDIRNIPLDDHKTYDLINKGDTIAVFQLESTGMQKVCRKFGVENIKHIIALIALYRPGPMDFIDDFVNRKQGKTKIEYDHPLMENILKETYGIMLYQEQIMQVVQALAGFTLGQADILRRAIGKKKVHILEEQKENFIKQCKEVNNIENKLAEQIWEKINKFAGYGFNKSHSAAYAILAYRTAWLKANYPVEFMAAVLSSELKDASKIRFFIAECKEMGIPILSPDINASDMNFSVDNNAIRFGLAAIKGVGEVAAQTIIENREKAGKYTSLLDFCERNYSAINVRVVEQLVRTGAFDSLKLKRSQLIQMIQPALSEAQQNIKDKESGQMSLFDMFDEKEKEALTSIPVPDIPELDIKERLRDERNLLGFYVTGHPLAEHEDIIKNYTTCTLQDIKNMEDGQPVKVCAVINVVQKRTTKKDGKVYAILNIEDLTYVTQCMVYNGTYEKEISLYSSDNNSEARREIIKNLLQEHRAVFIEGRVQLNEDEPPKLVADNIVPIECVLAMYTSELHLHLFEGTTGEDKLHKIENLCRAYKGDTKVILCVAVADKGIAFIEAAESRNVRINNNLISEVKNILGEHAFKLKGDKSLPEFPRERRYIN